MFYYKNAKWHILMYMIIKLMEPNGTDHECSDYSLCFSRIDVAREKDFHMKR